MSNATTYKSVTQHEIC